MKIAGKIILALLLISSTLLSTNCYADFIAEGCADSYNLAARDDPKAWNDRCQDLHMQKTFGNRWKEVKDFYFKFKKAVADNDKNAVIKMMHYPVGVYYGAGCYDSIEDEKMMLKQYDGIFNNDIKEMIIEHEYQELYISDSAAILACKYTDPLTNTNVSFGVQCSDQTSNSVDYIKTCYPYSIKIDSINW